ncbi:hypothetical protein BJV82DRAFT_575797 [Fennellomyces sp. T-0311]|nr:hypothetical protein BJV82DRAFT_575797 [Fennellomyces sp. T-0311]
MCPKTFDAADTENSNQHAIENKPSEKYLHPLTKSTSVIANFKLYDDDEYEIESFKGATFMIYKDPYVLKTYKLCTKKAYHNAIERKSSEQCQQELVKNARHCTTESNLPQQRQPVPANEAYQQVIESHPPKQCHQEPATIENKPSVQYRQVPSDDLHKQATHDQQELIQGVDELEAFIVLDAEDAYQYAIENMPPPKECPQELIPDANVLDIFTFYANDAYELETFKGAIQAKSDNTSQDVYEQVIGNNLSKQHKQESSKDVYQCGIESYPPKQSRSVPDKNDCQHATENKSSKPRQ